MAMGARKALQESRRLTADGRQPLYCGIDGLPGKNGGIQLVRDSVLDASYIYPTHGDQLIDLAVRILKGEPHEKETMMQSALVTEANAKVLLMETEEMMHQSARLDQLHDKADTYLRELDTQRIVSWLAVGVISLLIVVLVLFYLYHLNKVSRQREHVVNSLWNMDVETLETAKTTETEQVAETPKHTDVPVTASGLVGNETPVATVVTDDTEPVSAFITRFKEVVESRLSDSDISVEDLAADMHLSRVQLYRKVKAVTGSSPVELLRTARLKRAYQLLLTTEKSVSEVAYDVGFTAPSYFTKCFKEEYGMLPGEVRTQQ
jgi:AraC-like DNA-binding protein